MKMIKIALLVFLCGVVFGCARQRAAHLVTYSVVIKGKVEYLGSTVFYDGLPHGIKLYEVVAAIAGGRSEFITNDVVITGIFNMP